MNPEEPYDRLEKVLERVVQPDRFARMRAREIDKQIQALFAVQQKNYEILEESRQRLDNKLDRNNE